MDDLDRADRLIEQQIALGLAKAARSGLEAVATGLCLNCGEKLAQRAEIAPRWCDDDCRDDWQKRKGKQ